MIRTLIRHGLFFSVYGLVFSSMLALVVFFNHLQSRSDLRPWHSAELDEEFRVTSSAAVRDLADYLQLEERLFRQLQEQVYDQLGPSDFRLLNRYNKGSLSDPGTFTHNWNRSFEMPVDDPRGGVLLIHGLSDSPYSMRSLAQSFHDMNYWVVGLRLPGHGTAPSGLLDSTWEDFAAAVEIAAAHVQNKAGTDKPFFMAGFSTGAALSVEYSLGILDGDDGRMPDGLILLSPAIGVTPLAALAGWQARLSVLPGFEKTAWESILPEFDPYRYKSFAVNAGDQIYRLTVQISRLIDRLNNGEGIHGFPEVIAFQSVVDATVSTPDLVSGLFDHLADEGHELVLFDINRSAEVEPVLMQNPEAATRALLENRRLPFTLTVLSNASSQTSRLSIYQKLANSDVATEAPSDLEWPDGVFALSHSSVPFPPDDSVYGTEADPEHPGIHLGRIDIQGETGVLLFSADEVIKLRYNPFHSYMIKRVEAFVKSVR